MIPIQPERALSAAGLAVKRAVGYLRYATRPTRVMPQVRRALNNGSTRYPFRGIRDEIAGVIRGQGE